MDITELLDFSVKQNASDLHLSAGVPPMVRVDGDVRKLTLPDFTHAEVHRLVTDIMNDAQRSEFEEKLEVDFSFELPNVGRFRVNAFNQSRGCAAVFRTIPVEIPSLEQLVAPEIFTNIANYQKGLVLITGPTGSGKSTTLAAMVDYINENHNKHVLTIEDPIEFVHKNKKCLINQREVHRDTHSFKAALRSALREDPDVILVGELRDQETISLALTAAETGHLVFGTLHTSSAAKTIDRIIDVFPGSEKSMVRSMLSESLKAVVAQTLLKRTGGGRVACHEVMIATPAIRNLIREDKVAQMYSIIQTGSSFGMQTMEQNAKKIIAQGLVDPDEVAKKVDITSVGFLSMTLDELLHQMVQQKASDIYLTVDAPCLLRVHGELQAVGQKQTEASIKSLLAEMMDDDRQKEFHQKLEANFAIVKESGRFRVSAFWQREQPGAVIRRIEMKIPSMESLNLPDVMKDLSISKRGLVLVVGATGSGKSTSMAAMTGYRNANRSGHILTVEDPIEFVHPHNKCIVTQREVGLDTESYEIALKNSLRQAPDMILIGEIRSRETMEYAMTFAETGHLCMATLHANNANQALERILHLVPKDHKEQFLFDLSMNLKGIIAQQLVPDVNGNGRHGVYEVLLNTPRISDLIRRGDLHEIKATMAKSRESGMQTFDQCLFDLVVAEKISEDEALHSADSANDLRLMLKTKRGDSFASAKFDNVSISLD